MFAVLQELERWEDEGLRLRHVIWVFSQSERRGVAQVSRRRRSVCGLQKRIRTLRRSHHRARGPACDLVDRERGAPSGSVPARAAHAPQLFAGLHEATSLRWRAWRFRIRSGAACGATSPDCERCWTGRYRRAFTASGRLPIASVKRSIFAMAAAGGSARAAARRWPTSRRQATSRCLGVGPLAAVCGARVCSRTRWRRRLRCLARSARSGTWRWCGWRPTSSAGSGTR